MAYGVKLGFGLHSVQTGVRPTRFEAEEDNRLSWALKWSKGRLIVVNVVAQRVGADQHSASGRRSKAPHAVPEAFDRTFSDRSLRDASL